MSKLITNIGNQKLLVASPMSPVTFKSIAVGTGTGSFDASILALKNEVWRGDITSPVKNSVGDIEVSTFIPSTAGPWTLTEWGIFDTSGDLIAYGSFDNSIRKELNWSIQPDISLALGSSLDAQIIMTDVINWDHNKMTNRSLSDSHPIAAISGLTENLAAKDTAIAAVQTDLNTKDAQNVKITGNQDIEGNKRFANDTSFKQIVSWFEGAVVTFGAKWMKLLASNAANSTEASINLNGDTSEITFTGKMIGDGSGLNAATTSKAGVISVGTNIDVASGKISVKDASSSQKGLVQIATVAEVRSGLDVVKPVTPMTLRNAFYASGLPPMYAVRAWGKFDGNSKEILAQGNIASFTKTNLLYRITFDVAMPDANYSASFSWGHQGSGAACSVAITSQTATYIEFRANYGGDNTAGDYNPSIINFMVVC